MPELNKIAQKERGSFAQNVAASMGANSFDDTGIIHALRKNKKVELGENTIAALKAKTGIQKAINRRLA
jgi:hypothetical protein